jgi:membrane fusion protein, multidrug efflux system
VAGGQPKARVRRAATKVGFCTIIVAGGLVWYWAQGAVPAPVPKSQARAAVPVSVVPAVRQDVPVYLSGLGTVQASYTVGIHAQVDGKLQEVFFTEGQNVRKGDLLAKVDPRLYQAALDQARAKKAQDAALLYSAQRDLDRFKTLALKAIESQQNVDRQQGSVDQLKAAIAADEAMIETAQTQLDYTNITAPSDGRIGMRLIDPGNIVHAADSASIATLTLTRPCAVLFTLPARALEDVRAAMARGRVEVVAYDADNARALSAGNLLLVDNTIDQSTATIRLKAIFQNEDDRLWPGQFVNVRVLLATRSNVVVIPPTAVQRGPNGVFTWVVTERQTVEPHPIEVASATKEMAIVASGLQAGELVVTGGQYKLKRDAQVTATAPLTANAGH